MSVLIAPARPVYYSFVFNLGPGFNVPLNFLPRSMSAFVQRRLLFAPSRVGFGGVIFLFLIHDCKVCREIPISSAACSVV